MGLTCFTLPVIHYLQSFAIYILFSVIVAYGRRANSIRVLLPWLEAGLSLILGWKLSLLKHTNSLL